MNLPDIGKAQMKENEKQTGYRILERAIKELQGDCIAILLSGVLMVLLLTYRYELLTHNDVILLSLIWFVLISYYIVWLRNFKYNKYTMISQKEAINYVYKLLLIFFGILFYLMLLFSILIMENTIDLLIASLLGSIFLFSAFSFLIWVLIWRIKKGTL